MGPAPHKDHAIQPEQRREQIMAAAMTCFARRGFHQTTMQDIGNEAGISVGLIYRYFESKDQVIAVMAGEHLAEVQRKLDDARKLPTLFGALEKVLWCDAADAEVAASFVVDLFAESARNPHVRALLSRVHEATREGVTSLIAGSPEAAHLAPGIDPRQASEAIFQAIHGQLFDEVLYLGLRSDAQVRQNRVETLRRTWSLLFPALRDDPRSAP